MKRTKYMLFDFTQVSCFEYFTRLSVSLSFKTKLTSVIFFAMTLRKVNFKHGTRDGKHDDVTSRYEK